MKRIFNIILILFSLSILFLNLNTSVQAATTSPGLDACYKCPSLPAPYNNPSDVKVVPAGEYGEIPPLGSSDDKYICPNGTILNASDTDPNNSCLGDVIENAYCDYYFNPEVNQGRVGQVRGLPNPVDGVGVCGSGGKPPVCSTEGQGCIGGDTPEPTTCTTKEQLCTTQSECQRGTDCATYYCVNTQTNKLASYEDIDNAEILKCRSFPDGAPECGVADDPEACLDPFGEEPEKVCTNATASEDCFSGVCDEENNKCVNTLIPMICEEIDAKINNQGYYKADGHTGRFACKTALGTFSADTDTFTKSVLRLLLGLSGGILLILIIINGYKLMTSQGDPEKIKDAREGIIAAIAGILLIIFSITILQIITVDIIGIPGFSS